MLIKYLESEVKGTLPLGCLPLWGSEGVTSQYADRHFLKRNFYQAFFDHDMVCLFKSRGF
jgi:hypothetical protein